MVPADPMVHCSQDQLIRPCLFLLALVLAACTPALEYPTPPQKVMPPGPDPLPSGTLLDMGDGSGDAGILRDVLGAQAG